MALLDLFSNDPAEEAAKAQKIGLRMGDRAAQERLDTAYGKSDDYLERALALLDPYYQGGTEGFDLYQDALGLGGAEGNERATGAFQAGPGYQFALDQGLDQLERRAASRGMLGSGNTSLDSIQFSQGLANQEYGSWLDRLRGLGETGMSAAGGQGAIRGEQAGAQRDLGTRKADYSWKRYTGQGEANANAALNQYNVAGNILGGLTLGAKLLGMGTA